MSDALLSFHLPLPSFLLLAQKQNFSTASTWSLVGGDSMRSPFHHATLFLLIYPIHSQPFALHNLLFSSTGRVIDGLLVVRRIEVRLSPSHRFFSWPDFPLPHLLFHTLSLIPRIASSSLGYSDWAQQSAQDPCYYSAMWTDVLSMDITEIRWFFPFH